MSKKLQLSNNKVLTGTIGGLAEYIDMDPKMLRIIFCICVIFGGLSLWVYIIAWVIMMMNK